MSKPRKKADPSAKIPQAEEPTEAAAPKPRPGLPLALILFAALCIRLYGIGWGLPTSTHYFSYHTDETVVLQAAMGMNSLHGQLLPHFYRYGSLQLYLVNIANTIAFCCGAVNIVVTNFSQQYADIARMVLIGRLVTVFMGVGTVWATYALGARLAGRRAGLIAAAFLTLSPLHAQHSHFLTVDVPATLWSTIALLWSVRLATDDPKPLRAAVAAGLFAGLATATKYNLALILLPAFAACVVRYRGNPKQMAGLAVVAAGSTVVAFLIGCPGCLLESGTFVHDVSAEALHVSQQGGLEFQDTGNGFWYQLSVNLVWGAGPVLVLALIQLARGGWRGPAGLTLWFAVPYYVVISMAQVRYARYAIPLLPIVAILGAALVCDIGRAALARVVLALATLGLALQCAMIVLPMARPDPRDRALDYINAHNLASGPFGYATTPWFQSPPIDPYFTLPGYKQWESPEFLTPQAAAISYRNADWDMGVLDAHPPVVVLSVFDYRDAVRTRLPGAMSWLARLQREYHPVASYGGVGHPSLRLALSRRDIGLPYDMLYTDPETWVLVRNQP